MLRLCKIKPLEWSHFWDSGVIFQDASATIPSLSPFEWRVERFPKWWELKLNRFICLFRRFKVPLCGLLAFSFFYEVNYLQKMQNFDLPSDWKCLTLSLLCQASFQVFVVRVWQILSVWILSGHFNHACHFYKNYSKYHPIGILEVVESSQ